MASQSIVVEKSFDFAVRIVRLYQYLCDEKKEYVLSKQLLRAGTSIGANANEATQRDWALIELPLGDLPRSRWSLIFFMKKIHDPEH